MDKKRNLNLVQLLRGIASLLVVLMHATVNAKDIWKLNFLGGFFSFGGAGVDIFFVLSGFIITYTSMSLLRNSINFRKFFKRRFVRIFPVYWIIGAVFLAIQIVLPAFYNTPFTKTQGNLIRTFFLFPEHEMLNGVSWTLSYELFFYMLFSLSFLIKKKNILTAFYVFYVLSIIFLPFIYPGLYDQLWSRFVFYPMNIEFFMGIAAALIIPRISLKTSVVFLITGALAFITAGVFANNGYYLFDNLFNRVVIFGIPSFFIVAAIVRWELGNNFSIHNLLLRLGEASYSLYLIHLPLLIAMFKIAARLNITNAYILNFILFTVICILCIISLIFYKIVEKPMIDKLNTILK